MAHSAAQQSSHKSLLDYSTESTETKSDKPEGLYFFYNKRFDKPEGFYFFSNKRFDKPEGFYFFYNNSFDRPRQ
jgi:hypothetical protein